MLQGTKAIGKAGPALLTLVTLYIQYDSVLTTTVPKVPGTLAVASSLLTQKEQSPSRWSRRNSWPEGP